LRTILGRKLSESAKAALEILKNIREIKDKTEYIANSFVYYKISHDIIHNISEAIYLILALSDVK